MRTPFGLKISLISGISALSALGLYTACSVPADPAGASYYHLQGKHRALSCIECHADVPLDQTPSTCIECHAEVAPETHFTGACSSCHTEAGWDSVRRDHDFFPLENAHSTLQCVDCHTTGVLAPLNTSCASCHTPKTTPHYDGACDDCHSTKTWTGVTWDHGDFPLDQGHAQAQCLDCHTLGDFAAAQPDCVSCHLPVKPVPHFDGACSDCHSVSGWTNVSYDHGAFPMFASHGGLGCVSCHLTGDLAGQSPDCESCHTPVRPQPHFDGVCADCHTVVAWSEVSRDHRPFPMTRGHSSLACSDCHSPPSLAQATPDCASCHLPIKPDPHFVGGCDRCHDTRPWATAVHDHGGFSTQGGHNGLQCTACHPSPDMSALQPNCEFCHEATRPVPHFDGLCVDCHAITVWTDVSYSHTRLPMNGGHAAVSCTSCHQPPNLGPMPTDCASCHEATRPLQHFTGACENCHDVSAWTNASHDHGLFPMTRGHGGLVCADCHTAQNMSAVTPVCESCHAAVRPVAHFAGGCKTCHPVTVWTDGQFDHRQKFPLPHKGISTCTSCHLGGDYSTFSCIDCHTHNKTVTDSKHRSEGVWNYVYRSSACLNCHPTGQSN